jgi:hypothetical protein
MLCVRPDWHKIDFLALGGHHVLFSYLIADC